MQSILWFKIKICLNKRQNRWISNLRNERYWKRKGESFYKIIKIICRIKNKIKNNFLWYINWNSKNIQRIGTKVIRVIRWGLRIKSKQLRFFS